VIQETGGPNNNAVWIALIGAISTVVLQLGTFWLSRSRQVRIEQKADTASSAAAAAVTETRTGNEAIAEVHRTVNGRTDALLADKARLEAELAAARAELGHRRSSDAS
jgi:hypothetical protein